MYDAVNKREIIYNGDKYYHCWYDDHTTCTGAYGWFEYVDGEIVENLDLLSKLIHSKYLTN
jgi:hypothetical protein